MNNIVIEYRKRRTFLIKVLPSTQVQVLAPKRASLNMIHQILHKRAAWIEAKRKFYAGCELLNKQHQYIDGEEFLFLSTKLKLVLNASPKDYIEQIDNSLLVFSKNITSPLRIGAQIEKWYQAKASSVFLERLNLLSPLLKGLHTKFPLLKQRYMKQQWGSCSSKGVITLNTHLIKTPLECLDYVLMHELCHLVVMNHSKKYYQLLDRMMPDWRKRQVLLKRYVCAGLN